MLILSILLQDRKQVSYEVHNNFNLFLQSFYNLVLVVSLHIKLNKIFCHYNITKLCLINLQCPGVWQHAMW